LEALENKFGTFESGEDLYFALSLLLQFPGEALSDFEQDGEILNQSGAKRRVESPDDG